MYCNFKFYPNRELRRRNWLSRTRVHPRLPDTDPVQVVLDLDGGVVIIFSSFFVVENLVLLMRLLYKRDIPLQLVFC